MSMLNDILRNAVQAKASDVHINVGLPPLFRIHTVVQPSDFPIVTPEGSIRLAKEMMDEKRWADFEEHRDADFSYEIPGTSRFRVNAHFQRKSVGIAIRTINDKIRPIEQLFLPEIVSKLTYLPRGLILVTGPTGSGKSTTLAAMIDAINRREQGHIITLEDPIEYAFVSNKSCIEQREVGEDVPTFASGLRSMMRADPDIIMVGEIRDRETAQIAVEAALTGHLVLSTLHTNDAPGAVTRLIEMGIEPFLVGSAVDCVVAQRLARLLCEECKRRTTITADVMRTNGFNVGLDCAAVAATNASTRPAIAIPRRPRSSDRG